MADGSIIIEAKLETAGFMEGLAVLSAGLDAIVLQAQAVAAELAAAFSGGDGVAEGGSFLTAAIEAAQAQGPELAAAMQQAAQQAVEALRSGMDAGLSNSIGSAFAQGAADGISGAAGAVSGAAQAAAAGGVSAAQGTLTASAGHSIGVSFGQGIAGGISSQTGAIAAAAQAAAQAALSAAMAALQIHSPSRAAFEMGVLFDRGFAEGIEDNARLAENGAARMARLATEALAGEHAGVFAASDAGSMGRGEALGASGAQTGGTITIERIEVHTDKLEEGQDWAAAGRAMSDAFARQARYRGAFVFRG